MNKTRFRLLVFFMSLSLIGIILVQLYWVNSSLKSSDEQFRFHVQQVLGKVAAKLQSNDKSELYGLYNKLNDSLGREPKREEMHAYYTGGNGNAEGDKVIFSDKISQRDYKKFFDRDQSDEYEELPAENPLNADEDVKGNVDEWLLYRLDLLLKDYRETKPLETRITKEWLHNTLKDELNDYGVDTPFEFGLFKNGLATKIRSKELQWGDNDSYEHNIYPRKIGNPGYRLILSFPQKGTFILNKILGITALSLIFTLIIIIAYLSAINQLIKQKQISEIKTDFINNMTHEFKTPIATINLALDAMKNAKIMNDPEEMQRYLKMIKDENKRMHSQVENVLQISKLDKKELDITKEAADVQDILDDAVEHVQLIIDARHGTLTKHFNAKRTTALLNDVHFTNVLVNILDNAIKYSPDEPVIDIYTENVKDFILIKIQDHGLGMSKTTVKRIFEKFYREHTGDIHNVKGHGLGLAYVKRIVDDHNCNIYVESEKGKGSTFIIKMPLIN